MKRIAALLLVLCLILGGCAPAVEPGTPSTDASTLPSTEHTEPSTDPSEPSTDPIDPSTDPTEPSTDPTEPEVPVVLYRNPLTGEPLDAPWMGNPTAVVINNIKECLPQHGISQADILYEIETEGGITRCLALFSELKGIGAIGPVRSARTYFNNVAVSYGAPLVHCGGSPNALKGRYSDGADTISNWKHIDQMYNGTYFYRDTERRSQGYAYEHTLFTSDEKLQAALAKKGYNTTNPDATDFGLSFADDVALNGATAGTITVKFLGKKTTTMTYDEASGLYKASEYGSEWIDANTKTQLAFKNVMVLYADQWKNKESSYTRSYYDLIGTGSGVFACNGKLVPIKWTRDGLRDTFHYTLEDGTPLTLGVGTTYVAVASDRVAADYK